MGTKFDSSYSNFNKTYGNFSSKINVYIVNPEQTAMETHMFEGIDKYSPEGSRLRLLEMVATGKHIYQDCTKMDY